MIFTYTCSYLPYSTSLVGVKWLCLKLGCPKIWRCPWKRSHFGGKWCPVFGPQSPIPSAKVLSASTSIAPPVLGLLHGDPGPQLSSTFPLLSLTHPRHMPTAHPNGAQPRTFLGLVSIGMDSPQTGLKRPCLQCYCSTQAQNTHHYSEDNVPARFPQVGISTPSFLGGDPVVRREAPSIFWLGVPLQVT